MLSVEMAGDSHIGLFRKSNQDTLFFDGQSGLAVLADGIAGRKGGKAASSLAVKYIKKYLHNQKIADAELSPFLKKIIDEANAVILRTGNNDLSLLGMGTTLELLQFSRDKVFIAHLGDSRAYLYYEENFWQLTLDHNVETFVKMGWLKRETLPKEISFDAITRGLGLECRCEPDIYHKNLLPGEIYIIASDGLFDFVPNRKLAQIVRSYQEDLPKMVGALIDQANHAGGKDNISVVVAKVKGKRK